MFEVSTDQYILRLSSSALPDIYDSYVKSAKLSEEIDLAGEGDLCYFSLTLPAEDWPLLVVAQKYSPSGFGWNPGVLVVPETGVVFLGAGARLLAYDFRFWCSSCRVTATSYQTS